MSHADSGEKMTSLQNSLAHECSLDSYSSKTPARTDESVIHRCTFIPFLESS